MKSKDARIKWISRDAEKMLAESCNDAGMTATPPKHDENGWDFIVELPQNRISNVLLDAQPSPVKFLCQVKATDGSPVRVSVSNLEHLARASMPAFFFVVNYMGKNQAQSTHFCHFDANRIGQTLKRIRELQTQGKTNLNRHEMIFSLEDKELVNSAKFAWLKEAIAKTVGFDMAKYVREKTFWLENIGYDENRYIFEFSSSVDIGRVVDAHLWSGEIDVSGATLTSNRFGIPIVQKRFTEGILHIAGTPIDQCRLLISSRNQRKRIEVLSDVFSAGIPDLPEVYRKLRFSWLFTEMIMTNDGGRINFAFTPEGPFDLDDAIKSLDIIELCAGNDARFEIYKDGDVAGSMTMNDSIELNDKIKWLNRCLRMTRKFLDLCGFREKTQLQLSDLQQVKQNLNWLELAIGDREYRVGSSIEEVEQKQIGIKDGVFASFISLKIGEKTFMAFCWWKGKLEIKKNYVSAIIRGTNLWASDAFYDSEVERIVQLEAEFKSYCENLSNGSLMMRAFSLQKEVVSKLSPRRTEAESSLPYASA